MLVTIDPGLADQRLGLGATDTGHLIIGTRTHGRSLFPLPISQWPGSVYVARVLDEAVTQSDKFTQHQVELIAWGMLYPTSDEALAVRRLVIPTAKRVMETLRRGTWLYDNCVRAAVSIVRQNYFEGPNVTDESKTSEYPPTDVDGCFYSVEYHIPGAGKGGRGHVFGTVEDATRHAETTLKTPITWDA